MFIAGIIYNNSFERGGFTKQRIWELDAIRGLWVLLMILIHLSYDLIDLDGVWQLKNRWLYDCALTWGGALFVVISGTCATLGARPVRRGLYVFACGMLCTVVTLGIYLFRLADQGIIIYFGVLHCLGTCMLLWPLFRKMPAWVLVSLGLALSLVGLYLVRNVRVSFPWLVPLGLCYDGFLSSDYYPLLPNLGYFLIGAALGKALYRKKQTLLPCADRNHPVLRFLCFCGQKSLPIYLVHQPLLTGLIVLILFL